MNKDNVKHIIAVIAFIAAIVIGFFALFIPPTGIIDASVLWFTAQLLVFTSGILGIDIKFDSLKQVAASGKHLNKKEDKNEYNN